MSVFCDLPSVRVCALLARGAQDKTGGKKKKRQLLGKHSATFTVMSGTAVVGLEVGSWDMFRFSYKYYARSLMATSHSNPWEFPIA